MQKYKLRGKNITVHCSFDHCSLQNGKFIGRDSLSRISFNVPQCPNNYVPSPQKTANTVGGGYTEP